MFDQVFTALFEEFPLPVVLCAATGEFALEAMNIQAELVFMPTQSVDRITAGGRSDFGAKTLRELFSFSTKEEERTLVDQLVSSGRLDFYPCVLRTFDGQPLPVRIIACQVQLDGQDYFLLYFNEWDARPANSGDQSLGSVISSAFQASNVEDSIQTILMLAGRAMGVSRSYIFESISAGTTRNTYEWCAEGVQPAIQDLQELQKADYNYDVIISSGMYVADDVSLLPAGDREILEMQGIKSLAIIAIFDNDIPLGYVGFDDTEKYRNWSHGELQYLQSIAEFLATLIKRRDAERAALQSQNILRVISDNSEDIVYVNGLDDYKLKFVSRSLAQSLGKAPEELLDHRCWEVLQPGQTGPCPFCPIPKIQREPGADRSETYQWEFTNGYTGKTYLIKDNIIRWVDQQYVHIETAFDISTRKEYEERLQYFASTDTMTGSVNREWGSKLLEERMQGQTGDVCLCFLDVDGLKRTNDTLGHTAGDELLSETARIIKKHLGPNDIICRWGGDEFMLWLEENPGQAAAIVQRFQAEMNQYNRTQGKPFRLSVSFGIVPVHPGDSLDALVTEADALMYKDKMEKRGISYRRRRDD